MPPVSDTQLTDLATLKPWVGITASDTNSDTALARLIVVASGLFRKLVNRDVFIQNTITETHRGNNSNRLILNVQPVISVTSVSVNNTILQPHSTYYHGGYSFDKYGLTGVFYSFCQWHEYVVQYVAGFGLASTEAFMAEQAVCSIIYLWWKRRSHTDMDMQSLGNQVTARYIQDELPPETTAIINALKRVA